MDLSRLSTDVLPEFYRSVLNAWGLLKVERREDTVTGDSVLQECLFFNTLFPDAALQAGNSLHIFTQGGVTRLKDLMHLEKGCWKPAVELAETLAVQSVRMCEQFLWRVKDCLPPSVLELIEETLSGGYRTVLDLECPTFWVGLSVQPKQGWVIRGNSPLPVRFHEAEKKLLYNWSVRVVNAASFQTLPTSKWSECFEEDRELTPAWRTIYKPPLPKSSFAALISGRKR
ncbi:hypothetical protein SKAU_G00192230 [Synaphobranchus kaupii]|uniref:Uncharacterized protein n=1 Tax=Synaphobranchus kaupii TaxID=118154 RepID=A0A9Q1FDV9_SYNKA|nr:hypothetical protein SKAU_G00192230 [Synaphobranchus kaupii]